MAADADDVVAGELVEPLAVAPDFGFLGIKKFEDLREVSFGVGFDLFAGERRTGLGLAGGVANHGGEITDKKNGGVAEILKMFELAKDDRVSEMNVGGGRVHAKIGAKGLAGLE